MTGVDTWHQVTEDVFADTGDDVTRDLANLWSTVADRARIHPGDARSMILAAIARGDTPRTFARQAGRHRRKQHPAITVTLCAAVLFAAWAVVWVLVMAVYSLMTR